MPSILKPSDVDLYLSWPIGRAEKLAKAGKIPHLKIEATGDIRFDPDEVQKLLRLVPVQCEYMRLAGGGQ